MGYVVRLDYPEMLISYIADKVERRPSTERFPDPVEAVAEIARISVKGDGEYTAPVKGKCHRIVRVRNLQFQEQSCPNNFRL
jgi:hypothetical protein